MARRRPVELVEPRTPRVPKRLQVCVVEDWVDDVTADQLHGEYAGLATNQSFEAWATDWLMLHAWRQSRVAFRTWVKTDKARRRCPPLRGMPVWRDRDGTLHDLGIVDAKGGK